MNFHVELSVLGFTVNFSSGASGKIDYTPISLLPDDIEYVRYINDSHIVSCIGEDERYLQWQSPDGAEVEEKGRVHVEAFDGQLRLIISNITTEDAGNWMCCRESDENDGQSFDLKVYGERKIVTSEKLFYRSVFFLFLNLFSSNQFRTSGKLNNSQGRSRCRGTL